MRDGKEQHENDENLFAEAMEGVRRIDPSNIAPKPVEPREPVKQSPSKPEPPVIQEEHGFRKPGIQESVFRDLRSGRIPIEGELDLHGLTQPEAKRTLDQFLRYSQAKDRQRAVRIIHGKGHGSQHGKSALRESVIDWLRQSDAVLAFSEAGPGDGGSGAVRVLLKRA
jgi:DNA-nicking Smr family endonuclease